MTEEIKETQLETPPKTRGQVAFEAYNEAKGGLTWDGKPIPPWTDVGDEVREAWEAAAIAAAGPRLVQVDREDLRTALHALATHYRHAVQLSDENTHKVALLHSTLAAIVNAHGKPLEVTKAMVDRIEGGRLHVEQLDDSRVLRYHDTIESATAVKVDPDV